MSVIHAVWLTAAKFDMINSVLEEEFQKNKVQVCFFVNAITYACDICY